jgi:hypothetical protein
MLSSHTHVTHNGHRRSKSSGLHLHHMPCRHSLSLPPRYSKGRLAQDIVRRHRLFEGLATGDAGVCYHFVVDRKYSP